MGNKVDYTIVFTIMIQYNYIGPSRVFLYGGENMKNNMKKIINYKLIFIIIFCIFFLFQSTQDTHAYTTSNAGKNDFDTSGGFYFAINGGPSGNSQIKIQFKRISGATSYSNMMSATSRWSVGISSGTNRHNIQIVDTSVNTRLDVTDSYNVLSFRVSYDMPAHYQYSGFSDDSPSGMRFNMSEYSYSGDGANSAATNGYHSGSTTRRTVNVQVNTGNTGLRTFKKYWYYNCTMGLNIAKATRTVSQYHYSSNPNTGSWNHFNTTQTNVTDGNWFAPYNVGAPTGYSAGNNYGYYSSSGAELGSGTIGSNGFTVCDNNTVNVHYYPNNYNNSIAHWAGGYKYGEGDNGGKNMKLLSTTSFAATYSTTFNMGTSRAVSIPRGFYLGASFGSPSISGGWGSYSMGTNVTQGASGMNFEYYYYPYNYTIQYDLNGGSMSGQPTTYTVLYEENIPNPTRVGHVFMGWTGTNGETPQKNLKIPVNSVGNVTYKANWKNNKPVISGPSLEDPDNNEIKPFIDKGKLIIQLGDVFTPSKYMSASDTEDGNLSSSMKIINNVPMHENRAIQSGVYNVLYSVTDKGGATSSYTLSVLVNDPPTINSYDRTFFKNQFNIDEKELLRKLKSEDKEDGNITSNTKIESVKYKETIDTEFKVLDTSETGEIIITYTVTDSYRKTVSKEAKVIIVNNDALENNKEFANIRFISADYIDTLSNKSFWKTDTSLNTSLKNSLENKKVLKEYNYTNYEVKLMKEFMDSQNYKKNQTTNNLFNELFIK